MGLLLIWIGALLLTAWGRRAGVAVKILALLAQAISLYIFFWGIALEWWEVIQVYAFVLLYMGTVAAFMWKKLHLKRVWVPLATWALALAAAVTHGGLWG